MKNAKLRPRQPALDHSNVQNKTADLGILREGLEKYRNALTILEENPDTLFSVLLLRDKLDIGLKQTKHLSVEIAEELSILDKELAESSLSWDQLAGWRRSICPPETAWWWRLDQLQNEHDEKKSFLWILLTGTLTIFTLSLAVEIIKRLWDGAPDSYSVIGTLLTLLITGSPYIKNEQEFGKKVLERIWRIYPRKRIQVTAIMTFLVFVVVALSRILILPQLAVVYNNWGHNDLGQGDLSKAQQHFRRAVALNPDQVVPYQNLADVYLQSGRPEDAISWFKETMNRDLNFVPAYSGLGHAYNLQGDYSRAELVLLAGLEKNRASESPEDTKIIHYQLLSDLGWSYFAQGRSEQALSALESAILLEDDLKLIGEERGTEYRLALPHFYLAQVYEQMGRYQGAMTQWEDSLRYLDQNNWSDREWIAIALDHINKLGQ